jgi:nitrite reductase (NADH) small subunit
MAELYVGKADDLSEGERTLVSHGTHEIAVFRVKGTLRAFLNLCPHQGGPACEGVLINRVEEIIAPDKTYQGMRFTDDLHVVCPWHGWEFDVETGLCAGDGKLKLRSFPVMERDGEVYVVTP